MACAFASTLKHQRRKSKMTKVLRKKNSFALIVIAGLIAAATPALADDDSGVCSGLPSYEQLKSAIQTATAAETSGLNLNMWATIVDRDGNVCAVAFSGGNRGAQWMGSRV